MLRQFSGDIEDREALLARAFTELASELRMVDIEHLVDFIRNKQFGNIAQLVASSAELYYTPGTIVFLNSAETLLNWGADPGVALDLKFENNGVSVYFRLFLECASAGLQIDYLAMDDGDSIRDDEAETTRLRDAIEAAKFRTKRCRSDDSQRPISA